MIVRQKFHFLKLCVTTWLLASIAAFAVDYGDYSGFTNSSAVKSGTIFMGTGATDDDVATLKNATATGDNTNATNDEDGVTMTELMRGVSATVSVKVTNTSGANVYLNGWIDFNKNNALTNTGEQIITNQTITSGTSGVIKTYTFTVPTGATLGDVGARFRISSISGAATSTASTGNGEVEDYVFTILAASDSGDFQPFGAVTNTINANLKLGAATDANVAATNMTATSDDITGIDDEDGITVGTLTPGGAGSIIATITNNRGATSYLNGWLDFNNDGTLNSTDERVINNLAIPNGTTNLSQLHTFTIPPGATIGDVGARFRISATANPGSTGTGTVGEIEDYLATIRSATLASPMLDYNVIVRNNLSVASDVDGRILTKNITSAGSVTLAKNLTGSATSTQTVQVQTNVVAGASLNLQNGSFYAPSAGALNGRTVNYNGGGTFQTTPAPAFTTIFNDIVAKSSAYASIPSTGTFTVPGSASPVTLVINSLNANGVAVFNVDGNQLLNNGNVQSIDINLNGFNPVAILINCSGSTVSYSSSGNFIGNFLSLALRPKILWNFHQATTLNYGKSMYGSTLAPLATLNATAGAVEGSVAVNNLTSNIEIHLPAFGGGIATPSNITVGNMVWNDINQNGLFDGGEAGIDGVVVNLKQNGTQVATATTSGGGWYGFSRPPGTGYTLEIPTVPAAYPYTSGQPPNDYTDNGNDGDNNGYQPGGPGTAVRTAVFDLTANGEPGSWGLTNAEETWDFGFRALPNPTPLLEYKFETTSPATPVTPSFKSTCITSTSQLQPAVNGMTYTNIAENGPVRAGTRGLDFTSFATTYNAALEATRTSLTPITKTLYTTFTFAAGSTGTIGNVVADYCPDNSGNKNVRYFLTWHDGTAYRTAWTNTTTLYKISWTSTDSPFVNGAAASIPTGSALAGKTFLLEAAVWGGAAGHVVTVDNFILGGTCTVVASTEDFGDLADTTSGTGAGNYQSLLANNGPRHTVTAALRMGATNTAESDALHNTAANGDSSDDGVATLPSLVAGGSSPAFNVSVANTGAAAKLSVWIDFNNDGAFNDTVLNAAADNDGEKVALDLAVATSATSVTVPSFKVPANAYTAGAIGVRLRLSTTAALTSLGAAPNGEVEDYKLTIAAGVAVGNLVYVDNNDNGRFDTGEGANSILVQAKRVSDNVVVGSATTDAAGLYQITGLVPGSYYLFIPASEFGAGKTLNSKFSLLGNGGDNGRDDDWDENGIDDTAPATNGIRSPNFTLAAGGEPTTSETGADSGWDSGAAGRPTDNNADLTFDFGFSSCAQTNLFTNGSFETANPVGLTFPHRFPNVSSDPIISVNDFTNWGTTDVAGWFRDAGSYINDATHASDGNRFIYLSAGCIGQDVSVTTPISGLNTLTAGQVYTLQFDWCPFDHTQPTTPSAAHNRSVLVEMHFVDASGNEYPVVDTEDHMDMQSNTSSTSTALSPWSNLNWRRARYQFVAPAALSNATRLRLYLTSNGNTANNTVLLDNVSLRQSCSPQTCSVGNFVYNDLNSNGRADAGEPGIDDVMVYLFRIDASNNWTQAGYCMTRDGGRYFFPGVVPGNYVVMVQAENFQSATPWWQTSGTGRLYNMISTPGNADPNVAAASALDDNAATLSDKGIDDLAAATNGLFSPQFTLGLGTEPVTGAGTENGFLANLDSGADSNGDMTLDFGFTYPNDYGDVTGTGFTPIPYAIITPNLRLGALIDGEAAPLGSTAANQDDILGADDEDGYVSTTLSQGSAGTITLSVFNNTGSNKFLYGWLDLNGNGNLDAGENATDNAKIVATNAAAQNITLSFGAPTTSGNLKARFRISSLNTGVTAVSSTGNGEIEDHLIPITVGVDFGDWAHATNPTGAATTTTTSTRNANLRLGAAVDTETSVAPTATATVDNTTGTNDEDGVTMPGTIVATTTVTIPVSVYNNTGANSYLHAWIDFNNDGVFNNALVTAGGERLEAARTIASGSTASTQGIQFTVPTNASIGLDRGVRFRLTNQSGTLPTGASGSGEIEDYTVDIAANLAIGNLVWLDTNGNGIKDAAESGVNGVAMHLLHDANADGVLLGTELNPVAAATTATISTVAGTYSFSGLAPGKYAVRVASSNFGSGQPLVSYILSSTPVVTADNAVDNDNNGQQPHSGYTATSPVITLAVGTETSAEDSNADTDMTIDFGFRAANPLCKILFICGEAKPQDGEAFDHGLMRYIETIYEPGTITPVLAKNTGATLGLYNAYAPGTEISVTLANYDMIIVSATCYQSTTANLNVALRDTIKPVLVMTAPTAVGMKVFSTATLHWSQSAWNGTANVQLTDWLVSNPAATYSPIFETGTYYATGTGYLWANSTDQAPRTNALFAAYPAGALSAQGAAATHGGRVFFGLHMNSAQQNAANSGLPVPESEWLSPTIDLTPTGKAYLDQALSLALPPCIYDFGDYLNFPAANQVASAAIKIGTTATDINPSNPANSTASGDDNTGTDDEDLTMPTFTVGAPTALSIPVTVVPASLSAGTARLRVFVDWNGDNDVNDLNESTTELTVASSNSYSFNLTPPAGTTAGTKYLRIRVSEGTSVPAFSGTSTLKGEVEDYAVTVNAASLDYGDYSRYLSAASTVNAALRIGALVDAESVATTNTSANGDDITGQADEDGVTLPTLPSGQNFREGVATSLSVAVTNTTGAAAYLNAWVDWNRDNDLLDAGEQITTNLLISTGTNNVTQILSFTPPTIGDGVGGGMAVRLRLTSVENPGPTGTISTGEVQDHYCTLAPGLDYGDMLGGSGTTTGLTIYSGVRLGAQIDAEAADQPNATATGDDLAGVDDEDGVTIPPLTAGQLATIQFNITNNHSGLTQAVQVKTWIDWNRSGIFNDDTGGMVEAQSLSAAVPSGVANGTYTITVTPPAGVATGVPIAARFNLMPQGTGHINGNATHGEIEDYMITVNPAPSDYGDWAHATRSATATETQATSSTINTNLRLGATVDTETSVAPTVTATVDNTTGTNDEDGLIMPTSIAQGTNATIPVSVFNNTGANAYLNAWIDFNDNGIFDNALISAGGERLEAARTIGSAASASTQHITFTVPAGASLGTQRGVRFRLTNQAVTLPTGASGTGEVEDYVVSITPPMDFGDATGYAQATASQNASTPKFGALVDYEGTQPADDNTVGADEDGIYIATQAILGKELYVNYDANTTAAASVNIWVDWNRDGDFADVGEQVLTDASHSTRTSGRLKIPVPMTASPGASWLRARISSATGALATGSTADGEVEDHPITIADSIRLSGVVFEDANNNGQRDVGERLLHGVQVAVQDVPANSALRSSTFTDNAGAYQLSVPPGTWKVVFWEPTFGGFTFATPNTGNDLTDSDATFNSFAGIGETATMVLASGAGDIANIDCGLVPLANTITYTTGTTISSGDWSTNLTLPKYYDATASVAAVKTTVNILASQDMYLENKDTASAFMALSSSGVKANVTFPHGGVVSPFIGDTYPGQTMAANDGVYAFNPGAGLTYAAMITRPVNRGSIGSPLITTVSGYQGTAAGQTISLPLNITDTINWSGGVLFDSNLTTYSQASVAVTYYYVYRDFGDHIFGSAAASSASQLISPHIRIGTNATDAEPLDPSDALADKDNTTGTNDEDLTMPSFTVGHATNLSIPVTIPALSNLTNSTSRVRVFVDWNGDGDVNDANETLPAQAAETAGTNNVVFSLTPPLGTTAGTKYLRIRISEGTTDPLFSGYAALKGEVEDYAVNVISILDYGDLADTSAATGAGNYQTLLQNNGPRHFVIPGLAIGSVADSETDAAQSSLADGDDVAGSPDDEDGINYTPIFTAGVTSQLTINLTNTTATDAKLAVWFDFNNNGSFAESGEQVAVNRNVPVGAKAITIPVPVPAGATTGTLIGLRVRLSHDSGLTSLGAATDGEVEDYRVSICPTINIIPATLSAGTVGISYSQLLTATGGTPAYKWTIPSGTLPPGMNFTGSTIGGTPTTAGSWTFLVQAEDSLVSTTANPTQSDLSNNGTFAGTEGEWVAPTGWGTFTDGSGNFNQGTIHSDIWDQTGGGPGAYANYRTPKASPTGGTYLGMYYDGVTTGYARQRVQITTGGNYVLGFWVANPGLFNTSSSTWSATAANWFNIQFYSEVNSSRDRHFVTPSIARPATLGAGDPGALYDPGWTYLTYEVDLQPGYYWIDFQNYNNGVTSTGVDFGGRGSSTNYLALDGVSLRSKPAGLNCTGLRQYTLVIQTPSTDFGDWNGSGAATASTSSTTNANLRLGATVDTEATVAANAAATTDDTTNTGSADDEDGVTMPGSINQGSSVTIPVSVLNNTGGNAFLHAWIDFDDSKDFNNNLVSSGGERLEAARTIASSATASTQYITFTVPNNASVGTQRGVRFRLTNQSGTLPTGASGTGEIEDYVVTINNCLIVTSTADSGPGTLRAAITCANATPGTDTITFAISGAGTKTITLTSSLPPITDPIIIDGFTQSGASTNTLATGNNSVIMVEINGNSVPNLLAIYFSTGANGSTVRGLAINRCHYGVFVLAPSCTVHGNLIGTNITGTAALGNQTGISVFSTTGTQIGGTAPAARNVISGNTLHGIELTSNATANFIQGNYIGTNATGTAAVANQGRGIDLVSGSGSNTIGGTASGAGNVVSGNGFDGIRIQTTGNIIQGNYLGLNAAGNAGIGNGYSGIELQAGNNTVGGSSATARNVAGANGDQGFSITSGTGNTINGNYAGLNAQGTGTVGNTDYGIAVSSAGNTIGGTGATDGNVVAGNLRGGILVGGPAAQTVTMRKNSVYDNTGLGIIVGNISGLIPNDGLVNAGQANNGIDYPVFTSTSLSGSNLTVSGFVGASPAGNSAFANLTVEVFASDNTPADQDGEAVAGDFMALPHGEGRLHLGTISTDGLGRFTQSIPLTGAQITAWTSFLGSAPNSASLVTGTATDALGNTSAFGAVSPPLDYGDWDGSSAMTGITYSKINNNLRLGAAVDAEIAVMPNVTATTDDTTGTDDEDGVTMPTAITRHILTTIPVSVFNNTGADAYLHAWIDFNGDGAFNDIVLSGNNGGEKLAIAAQITSGASASTQHVTFTVPAAASLGAQRGVRFRLTDSSSAAPTGAVGFGEVEDYVVTINAPGSVGDKVFVDSNGNGLQDGGEPGLTGVTVALYDSTGTAVAGKSVVTNSSGIWSLTDITPGRYAVKFTIPSTYSFTLLDQGTNDENDSDAVPDSGMSIAFNLGSGESLTNVDAGVCLLPTIGDNVWIDYNRNGIQEPTETDGVNGITVTLYDALGGTVGTTTTGATGLWSMTNTLNTDFSVGFSIPGGYIVSPQNQGGNDTLDSDGNSGGRTDTYISTNTLYQFGSSIGDTSAGIGGDAGIYWDGITSTYNSTTKRLRLRVVISTSETDKLPETVTAVISDGATPDHSETNPTHAVLFLDYSTGIPQLTAYRYSFNTASTAAPSTWGVLLNTTQTAGAMTVETVGLTRIFDFEIDATPLLTGGSGWIGTGFDDKVGIWLRSWGRNPIVTYGSNAITSWNPNWGSDSTGQSFWDIAFRNTSTPCLPSRTDIDFGLSYNHDYGDLADSAAGTAAGNYETLPANNGPTHFYNANLRLGAGWDGETNGQPSAAANGDDNAGYDDEDGITTFPAFNQGSTVTIPVSVFNNTGSTARIFGFIDWNGDGDFGDANETLSPASVLTNASQQSILVSATVPTGVTNGQVGARFRVSTDASLSSVGWSGSGEVEDYMVTVNTASIGNLVWNDLNGDGRKDAGESGIGGVSVELWSITPSALVATTTTATTGNVGTYQFTGLNAGNYEVRIPRTNFFMGAPLQGKLSSSGNDTDSGKDDSQLVSDNGVDQAAPHFSLVGVKSVTINLGASEPIDSGTETGFANTMDNASDASGDMTVDFGFVAQTAGSCPPGNMLSSGGFESGTFTANSTLGGISSQTFTGFAPFGANWVWSSLTPAHWVNGGASAKEGSKAVFLPASSTNTLCIQSDVASLNTQNNYQVAFWVAAFNPSDPAQSTGIAQLEFLADLNTVYAPQPVNISNVSPGGTIQYWNSGRSTVAAASSSIVAVQWNLQTSLPKATDGTPYAAGKTLDLTSLNWQKVWVQLQPNYTTVRMALSQPTSGSNGLLYDGVGVECGTFTRVYGLGNTVFHDTNANSRYDAGEGVSGAILELFNGATKVGTSNTDATGRYLFSGMAAGTYTVKIPASEFVSGRPLAGKVSVTGAGGDAVADDNIDENGIDNSLPATNGIASGNIVIGTGNEPTDATVETGFDKAIDNGDDAAYDLTVDFGFVNPGIDFGDLADATSGTATGDYQTMLANNGPRHTIVTGFSLGASVDGEGDGQPSANADGDGTDENGITIPTLVAGNNANISFTITNTPALAGKLNAWIDWNNDGDFIDAGEQIATNATASASGTLPIIVPPTATIGSPLGARFRLSTVSGLTSVGAAADGEVEDYRVTVTTSIALGNTVWNDTNFNGIHDAGEFGINGVIVSLYSSTDNTAGNGDDVFLSTTTTNSSGIYSFPNLVAGKYVVRVTPPPAQSMTSGTVVITDNQVDKDNNGSQPSGQGTFIYSPVITLAPGTESVTDGDTDYNTELTVDFALRPCPTITIIPPILPPGNVNASYSETLTASGGNGTYSFSRTAGSLPAGLALAPSGVVSGIPLASGTFTFTAQAVDSLGCVGSREISITIRPLPVIHAMVKDEAGRYLIGGEFYEVNGVARTNIVRLNRDGSVDQSFAPAVPNGPVYCIAYRSGVIYAGGGFTTWGGTTQNLIVKLDASGNRDTAFAGNVLSGNAGDAVRSISENGFYVCGKFSAPRNGVAALDPSTGAVVTAFNATGPGAGSTLYDVLYDGSRVVTVGDFTTFNGATRRGIAALSTAGAFDSSWTATSVTDNTVRSVTQLSWLTDLLAVGDFTTYRGTSGLNGTARMDNGTGAMTSGYTGNSGLSIIRINKVSNP